MEREEDYLHGSSNSPSLGDYLRRFSVLFDFTCLLVAWQCLVHFIARISLLYRARDYRPILYSSTVPSTPELMDQAHPRYHSYFQLCNTACCLLAFSSKFERWLIDVRFTPTIAHDAMIRATGQLAEQAVGSPHNPLVTAAISGINRFVRSGSVIWLLSEYKKGALGNNWIDMTDCALKNCLRERYGKTNISSSPYKYGAMRDRQPGRVQESELCTTNWLLCLAGDCNILRVVYAPLQNK
ncbi:hypothetical protein CBL_05559 [Carabus blaptoides fortunei]